jgi:branched-chain amino acid transport system ATP-binding protein
MSVLETHELSIRFGGVQANLDVSVAVGEWEIVGVIGPNGAGKTTLFNMITGFYRPDSGRIVYRGRDITRLPVHERAALGLGRTFQNVGLVKGATVRDNLVTAQYLQADYGSIAGMLGSRRSFASERLLRAKADALADVLGLGDLLDTQVAGLPYGTLKRVEIATVLATDPEVLLLDEPSSGMGPEEAHRLGDTLLELRRQFGLSIVMIEHHVPLVVRVCDYVYCLDFGQLLTHGSPQDVRNHPQVVAAYLGEDPDPVAVALEAQLDALVETT